MNFKLNWQYGLLLVLAFILPIISIVPFYVADKESLVDQIYQNYRDYLSLEISRKIEAKKRSNFILATALSNLSVTRRVLEKKEQFEELPFAQITQSLSEKMGYKNVWIQLIDAKGISLLRSWTDTKNDSIASIRKDIADLIVNPREISTISIGMYAFSLKSIVPLYDDQHQLLGFIEVIAQFNSIDYELREQESLISMLLVNRTYFSQLTRIEAKGEFQGYLLVNHAAGKEELAFLNEHSVDSLVGTNNFQIIDDQFEASFPIQDSHGEVLAYWVVLKSLNLFDMQILKRLDARYIWAYLFIVALMISLVLLVFFKRKADSERLFFFQIFNRAKEIVFVTNRKQIVEANQAFFDLFDGYKTLEEFHQDYVCVCDMFVDEPGYLKPIIDGVYWYDYLLLRVETAHFAKILYRDKIIIVSVTASSIKQGHQESGFISILMADMTEQEIYKKELEHITIHDELTGLRNRHYFNQRIEEEIRRSQRYRNALSLIMFDIDHFKRINDSFGHDVGDLVLKKIATECLPYIRETDALCRIGGEEFMVIMPETQLEDAAKTAERLRVAVAEMSLGSLNVSVTISLGVVSLSSVENLAMFYKRADQALYVAKDHGRNCVVVG